MKMKTWKSVLAALLVCTTLVYSPSFHALASEDQSKSTGVSENKDSEEEEDEYTEAELRLMSALIFCEAGSEPYAGKVAVGIVVMNRVRSSKFPDTVKGVIYQRGQFSPARSGMLDTALEKYDNGKFTQKNHLDSIKAAKKALKGATSVTIDGKSTSLKGYLFFSTYLKNKKLKIGNHMFK
jgi:spore germination cell wall hydrolase CwlJ-like protein